MRGKRRKCRVGGWTVELKEVEEVSVCWIPSSFAGKESFIYICVYLLVFK